MMLSSMILQEKILKILASSPERYISGEWISKELGMTRAALWKHMQILSKLGWKIESSTKSGYRLQKQQQPFSNAGIKMFLKDTLFKNHIHFVESCDSTNTRLKQLAAEGAEEGTVVIALEQTGGRGRMGRTWASAKDSGIWMSILLRPDLHPMDVQVLTLAASVAVIETLQPHLSEKPGIKWPNDILVDGRKICGILTEIGGNGSNQLCDHRNRFEYCSKIRGLSAGTSINGNVDFTASKTGEYPSGY